MKNNKTFLTVALLVALVFVALSLTGCDFEDNSIAGFAYNEVGGSYVVTDSFGQSITYDAVTAKQIAGLSEAEAVAYLTAEFRQAYPSAYEDPKSVVSVAATETIPGDVVVSAQAQAAADSLSFIPGFGSLASLLANGALGLGALWLGKKKKRSDKVAESLVTGIDVFRDILDQTPQGDKIDAALLKVLKDRKKELAVTDEINALLQRYATPTKGPIDLES